jgi:hypothetical protein
MLRPPVTAEVRTLFHRVIKRCATNHGQHISIQLHKYYILPQDLVQQYEDVGHTLIDECTCDTSLPHTLTYILNELPRHWPNTAQHPYERHWVKIQQTIRLCNLRERPTQPNYYDHHHTNTEATYLVADSQISHAAHLWTHIYNTCDCDPAITSEIVHNVRQLPVTVDLRNTNRYSDDDATPEP